MNHTGKFGGIAVTDISMTPTELFTDGDMENGGVGDWEAMNTSTLTKETTNPFGGSQNLKIERVGAWGAASQTILTVGRTYRVTGWARGDGTATPSVKTGNTWFWTGIYLTGNTLMFRYIVDSPVSISIPIPLLNENH